MTDGDNRAALAVTRSLGRLRHQIIVAEKRQPSLAQSSRYCAGSVQYPDPFRDPAAFIETLAAAVRDQQVDVLVPVSDIATLLVTEHRARFEPHCALPFAPAAVVAAAANKVTLVETARRIGVPVPTSVAIHQRGDAVPDSLTFPLVIKPWRSRVSTPDGWRATEVRHVRDRSELLAALQALPESDFPLMLQERIVGPGLGVFAYYHQGQPVAVFGHRRLRERPPWGGVSVLSESVVVSPQARDFALRLLDAIGWHGVAMVEFKEDERDGLPKLMEINGRLWGSLQLAIDAGVNFPALLLQSVESGAFAPQVPYRVGVRNRWFWGDVDSLLLTLAGGRRFPAGTRPNRLSALLAFLRFAGRDLYYDNPKPDDMWPFVFETRAWLRRAMRAG